MSLRKLGVYGKNLPVKRARIVRASDFLIGGVVGRFERRYDKSFEVSSISEFEEIFGKHVTSSFYGWDTVRLFFQNTAGSPGRLYVAAHVGNTAGSIDAVVASRTKQDAGVANSLTVKSAYKENYEYGISGNRTATKITSVARFSTQAAAICAATGQSYAELDSVADIKVGDIILFKTNAGADLVYKKVTEVDEALGRVHWSGDFEVSGASGESLAVDDEVEIPGFTVQTYRKDTKGIVTEVETDLGQVVCTMESEVTDYYAPNVHAQNRWVVLEDESSASTLGDRLLATETDPVYCAGGTDGTAPTTAAHWAPALANLDDDPVRFLCNPETADVTIQKAGEAYCKARNDTPLWLYTIVEDQTKAQLVTIGNGYQRSDDVLGVIVANWLGVSDPFASGATAPSRHVPNVGAVMGAWIRSVYQNGVHVIPAINTVPLYGVVEVIGAQVLGDRERTDVADAGVNMIHNITGVGIVVRNLFTPSTDPTYRFSNGILMRNYIKVSAVDSLRPSENHPNTLVRIEDDRVAIVQFGRRLWDRGSNGNVSQGETFGQFVSADGTRSLFAEHFQVQADIVNNPLSSIQAGERNFSIYFTFPAPAGSIEIGVGILVPA